MTSLLDDFARRHAAAGNAPALCADGKELAARDFWGAVHARAGDLAARGIVPGDRVGLCMAKGADAVTWLFASLLCGAIAVPLDRRAPSARITAMLAGTAPALVIFDAKSLATFEASGGRVPDGARILVSDVWSGAPARRFAGPEIASDDPAVVLMTSGTTGDPKGITLTHGNIAAFSDWAIAAFALTDRDRFLNIAPLHFDLALLDVVTALRIGAHVTLASQTEAMFPAKLCALLEERRTSVLYTVPTILQAMVSKGALAGRELPNLRWVLFAGEVYPAPALSELRQAVPKVRLANLYGPTETNVIAWHEVGAGEDAGAQPSIGRACDHSRLVLCDAQGKPVEPGEIGEICVTGPTVMAGYWARSDLTRERFFAGDPLLFRTGDFAFLDALGDLRFVGRQDRQAKLRGNRIELAAVEACALRIDGVAAAAATVCSGGQTLCLHLALRPGADLFEREVLRSLAPQLARSELPDHFIFYEQWPTTSSGKRDLRLLASNHQALLAAQGGQA